MLYVVVQSKLINDEAEINYINQLNAGWQAGHNSRFENVTEEEAHKLLGLSEIPVPVSDRRARDLHEIQSLPASFDARRQWPSCVMPIRDQGNCGGCWSVAASSVFGARLCIQTGGRVKVDMSPQVGIDCNTANNGCSGGTIGNAWEYFKTHGTVAEADYPFKGTRGTCNIKSSAKRYYATSYTRATTVAAMQNAIYTTGPIQVGFDVYSDFYKYRSGIYSRTSNTKVGGHSVYLVGWGISGSTPYWIAINSWGSNFGMSGAFYIVRGSNMCNIEKGYLPIYGTIATATVTTTTKAPTTTTRAPTTTTRAPTTTTRAPTTKAPTTTTRAPTTTTRAPTTTTRAPTTTTRAPTTKAPTTTTRAPTTTTTRAPATTTKAQRDCWTCPAGFVHWYDIGLPEPSDKCACVPDPASRNCWTCPAGYVHWYDIGLPEPSDKCACVIKP
jgi:cathepsin B